MCFIYVFFIPEQASSHIRYLVFHVVLKHQGQKPWLQFSADRFFHHCGLALQILEGAYSLHYYSNLYPYQYVLLLDKKCRHKVTVDMRSVISCLPMICTNLLAMHVCVRKNRIYTRWHGYPVAKYI